MTYFAESQPAKSEEISRHCTPTYNHTFARYGHTYKTIMQAFDMYLLRMKTGLASVLLYLDLLQRISEGGPLACACSVPRDRQRDL